jgi:hypothetical protein
MDEHAALPLRLCDPHLAFQIPLLLGRLRKAGLELIQLLDAFR